MMVAIHPVCFIKPGSGGHINLASNDGLDAGGFCCIKKCNTTIHDTMVRDSNRRLPHTFDMLEEAVDAAGAIQQAIFSMYMQMSEVFSCHISPYAIFISGIHNKTFFGHFQHSVKIGPIELATNKGCGPHYKGRAVSFVIFSQTNIHDKRLRIFLAGRHFCG